MNQKVKLVCQACIVQADSILHSPGRHSREKVLQFSLQCLSFIIFVGWTLQHCLHDLDFSLKARRKAGGSRVLPSTRETVLGPKLIPPPLSGGKEPFLGNQTTLFWKQCTRVTINQLLLQKANISLPWISQAAFLILTAFLLGDLDRHPRNEHQDTSTYLIFCSCFSV